MAWSRSAVDRVIATGILGSAAGCAVVRLSFHDVLPNLSPSTLHQLVETKKLKAVTVVNLQYARVELDHQETPSFYSGAPYLVPLPGNPMMAIQYLEECIGPYSEPGSSMVSEDAKNLLVQIHGKSMLDLQADDSEHGRADRDTDGMRLHFEELGIPQEAWRNASGLVKWMGVYCAQAYTKSVLSMIHRA
jgi:hypothetical protein